MVDRPVAQQVVVFQPLDGVGGVGVDVDAPTGAVTAIASVQFDIEGIGHLIAAAVILVLPVEVAGVVGVILSHVAFLGIQLHRFHKGFGVGLVFQCFGAIPVGTVGIIAILAFNIAKVIQDPLQPVTFHIVEGESSIVQVCPVISVVLEDTAGFSLCPDVIVPAHHLAVLQDVDQSDVLGVSPWQVGIFGIVEGLVPIEQHPGAVIALNIGTILFGVIFDAIGVDSQHIFNVLRFGELGGGYALTIQCHGLDFGCSGDVSFDAQHIHGCQQQRQAKGCRQQGKTPEILQPEDMGRPLHQHLGNEPTNRQTDDEDGPVLVGDAQVLCQQILAGGGHKDGAEYLEHRHQLGEGNSIPGAFQIPLPVQHQCHQSEDDANAPQNPQGTPTVFQCVGQPDIHPVCPVLLLEFVGPFVAIIKVAGHHMVQGRQILRQSTGSHHAVQHGGVNRIHQPVGDHRPGIQQAIGRNGGKPVSGDHGGKGGNTEEADKIQIAQQKFPESQHHRIFKHTARQQRCRNQRHDGGGDEGNRQARDHIGNKPAFPGDGEGVEHIAHPGVIQVTKEKLSHQQGIAQLNQCQHLRKILHKVPGKVEGFVDAAVVIQQKRAQNQAQGIHHPNRREPGQVLLVDGLIKAGCL